jgi:hypothetical protein
MGVYKLLPRGSRKPVEESLLRCPRELYPKTMLLLLETAAKAELADDSPRLGWRLRQEAYPLACRVLWSFPTKCFAEVAVPNLLISAAVDEYFQPSVRQRIRCVFLPLHPRVLLVE